LSYLNYAASKAPSAAVSRRQPPSAAVSRRQPPSAAVSRRQPPSAAEPEFFNQAVKQPYF